MIIEYEKNDEYVTWGSGTNWHEASLDELIKAFMTPAIYCEGCKYWDSKSEWCLKLGVTMGKGDYCSRAERADNANSDTFTDNI